MEIFWYLNVEYFVLCMLSYFSFNMLTEYLPHSSDWSANSFVVMVDENFCFQVDSEFSVQNKTKNISQITITIVMGFRKQ